MRTIKYSKLLARAILIKAVDGMGLEEIEETYGIPPEAVKWWAKKAAREAPNARTSAEGD